MWTILPSLGGEVSCRHDNDRRRHLQHGVLRPLSALPLAEGTRVEVTITDVISGGRTGAELAGRWAALPHLSAEEAVAFERDEAAIRAAEAERSSPLR